VTATAEAPAKRAIRRSPQEMYEHSLGLLEQALYKRALVEGVKAARLTAQVAYELGGPEGVVRLLLLRLATLQFEDQNEVEETLALYAKALNTAKLKFRAAGGDPSAAEAAAEARSQREEVLHQRAREQHQQWAQEQEQHRQRIANSLPAKPPMSTNTEALEASFAAPAAEDHAPSAGGRSHCRKAKGECGQRLAHKIDLLLQELKTEEPAPPMPVAVTPLQWERSHGEVDPEPEVSAEPEPEPMPEPEPASAAPPSPSGAGEQSADASAISSGGAAGGFTLCDDLDHLQRVYQFLAQAYENGWHLPASVITSLVGASPAGVQWKAYGFEFCPATKHRDEVAWSVAPATWDFDHDGKPLRRLV
jgi:hypothetical protein